MYFMIGARRFNLSPPPLNNNRVYQASANRKQAQTDKPLNGKEKSFFLPFWVVIVSRITGQGRAFGYFLSLAVERADYRRLRGEYIGEWCNGSTQDFDSCGLGSSPGSPANID